ncbi:MAG: TrmH family RNA methyltransferase [Calditrichia bacterium]
MSTWKSYIILHKKRHRREIGLMLVEGARLCREAITSAMECEEIFVTESFQESDEWKTIETLAWKRQIECRVIDEKSLKRLAETESPQGIILIAHIPKNDLSTLSVAPDSIFLVLDSVRDPGNVGTLIRTADWFNAAGVLLADSVDPWSGKVLRSSMGSAFRLPVIETDIAEALTWLSQNKIDCIASTLEAKENLDTAKFNKPTALLLGSEAHGLSAATVDKANRTMKIAGFGGAESLNVAVAGGIFLEKIARTLGKDS